MPNKIVERCGRYMVLTPAAMKIASTRQLFIKRTMDIAGQDLGGIWIVYGNSAFLNFAPVIKIQSPRSHFFILRPESEKTGADLSFISFAPW